MLPASWWVRAGWYLGGVYRGMGTGWVVGGVYRYPAQLLGEGPHDSEAGPGSPGTGLEWVVMRSRARYAQTHPAGPVGPMLGPPWSGLRFSASGPIRARFLLISYKVSQNREVSSKSVHEASHSPYSQNGVQKSPLGFLGFPVLPAFSHKELMGLFRR